MKKPILRLLPLTLMGLSMSLNSNAYAQTSLLQEAERQLAHMHESSYVHKTNVNEALGRYNYDCSGFLDYSLQRVSPKTYQEVPHESESRPLAKDYFKLFSTQTDRTRHWIRLNKATSLHPGDLIAFRYRPGTHNNNTGHVMLVSGEPKFNPKQHNELLIRVIDSTESPHASDSRPRGQTGLGTGVIGILVNNKDEPIAYHWKGGVSTKVMSEPIALGSWIK